MHSWWVHAGMLCKEKDGQHDSLRRSLLHVMR